MPEISATSDALGLAEQGAQLVATLVTYAGERQVTAARLHEAVGACAHAVGSRAYDDGDFPGLDDADARATARDRAAAEAAAALAGGVAAQIRYLVFHCGGDATRRVLDSLA